MKNILSIFLFFFLYLISTESRAQEIEIKEVQLEDKYVFDEVIPLKNHGFVLSSYPEKSKGSKEDVILDFYNSGLTLEGSLTFEMHSYYESRAHCFTDDFLHFAYKRYYKLYINTVSLDDRSLIRVEVKGGKIISEIRKMIVVGDYVWLILSDVANRERELRVINWKTGGENIVPIEFTDVKSKDLVIMDVANHTSGDVMLSVKARGKKQLNDYYLVRCSGKGEKKNSYKVGEKENYVSMLVSETSTGEYIVSGEYAGEKRIKPIGIYLKRISNGEVVSNEKVSFSEEKSLGMSENSNSDHLVVHKTIISEHGYFIWGENYYINNHTGANNSLIWDGNTYTNGFLCGFDLEGKNIMNESFSINLPRVFINIGVCQVTPIINGTVKIGYSGPNYMESYQVDLDDLSVSEVNRSTIELGGVNDKIKNASMKIVPWYGGNYLLYGSQKIKTEFEGIKEKYTVFYVARVSE